MAGCGGEPDRALRFGLDPPHPRRQILCGDFNTPPMEADGQIITFGHTAWLVPGDPGWR